MQQQLMMKHGEPVLSCTQSFFAFRIMISHRKHAELGPKGMPPISLVTNDDFNAAAVQAMGGGECDH
jgi:hypothetical protein